MQNTQTEYQLKRKPKKLRYSCSPSNLSTLTIFAFCLTITINTTIAGGRADQHNLMDSFLQNQSNSQIQQQSKFNTARSLSTLSTDIVNNNVLVFNRGAEGVDNTAFETAFSLDKTLTKIRNTSNEAATDNSNTQLLGSLFNTLTTIQKENNSVNMDLQSRNQEANLSPSNLINHDMLPTAVFNRFDLSASDGKHCGEYRIIYHMNNGAGRFFLIFEAQYPNPEPSEGSRGCYTVADFWQKVGQKTKTEALVELEKFFYQGVEHEGINLPAAINFTHYTHETGQIRSNQFVNGPWQLREFKTDIDASGKAVLVADTVKDNPLVELFVNQQDSETDALKTLRVAFNNDFSNHYIDNLLTPEKQSNSPESINIINGFSLGNNNQYNEFQSDSSSSDNTAQKSNTALDAAINNKLDELSLSGYTAQMIRNRAEAMTCGGCHQNSNGAEVAPNVHWPNSGFFVHADERGNLSQALTEQFLPARASLLENYLQEVGAQRCGPACQLGSASSRGGLHGCAIQSDDSIECWGLNHRGQTDAPINLLAKQIAIGVMHTCALKLDNTVKCWGGNKHGQTDIPANLMVKQIALTDYRSCVLKLDNTVQCWGRNAFFYDHDINNLTNVTNIALGYYHACFLKKDSNIVCLGANSSLGDVPSFDKTVKEVAVGLYETCVIKLDNTVECWRGFNGRKYITDNIPEGLLVKHMAISGPRQIACAIRLDDNVQCWGSSSSAPSNLKAIKIVSGPLHTCAIKLDNSVQCWGGNRYGQLDIPVGLTAKKI